MMHQRRLRRHSLRSGWWGDHRPRSADASAGVAVLMLVCGCTYNVTDDPRYADVVARQNSLEQRQDVLEGRINTQSEELGRLRRGLPYHK